MIVTNFDGINATVVLDAVQAKAVRALLGTVSMEQCVRVSHALQMDGHKVMGDDVKTYAEQFRLALRRLAENINEKPEAPEVEQ